MLHPRHEALNGNSWGVDVVYRGFVHELNVGQLAHVAAFVFGGKDTDLNFIDLQWTIYQI